ncbi:hypothetical protein E5288_WYG007529 [Bos mutus]|uniref:Uncharacterized protein n=1 Tax=Bos mutus TaxID=72004 RepID=A0A6B0RBI9_9CETA|nr:hypothetical protein [Bos mutus]
MNGTARRTESVQDGGRNPGSWCAEMSPATLVQAAEPCPDGCGRSAVLSALRRRRSAAPWSPGAPEPLQSGGGSGSQGSLGPAIAQRGRLSGRSIERCQYFDDLRVLGNHFVLLFIHTCSSSSLNLQGQNLPLNRKMETKGHLFCQGEENTDSSDDDCNSVAADLLSRDIDSKKYIKFSKTTEKRISPEIRGLSPEHTKNHVEAYKLS